MIGKGVCLLLTAILFIGTDVMGSEMPIEIKPLREFTDVVNFVKDINRLGSDLPQFKEILEATVENTEEDYINRVFILYRTLSLLSSACTELETYMLTSIKSLISENYTGSPSQTSYEMQLVDVLWTSQTDRHNGVTLKEGYDASCIEAILSILKYQKNGNREAADKLYNVIEKALYAQKIDIGQFEQ